MSLWCAQLASSGIRAPADVEAKARQPRRAALQVDFGIDPGIDSDIEFSIE
jgi:hypothetical protein